MENQQMKMKSILLTLALALAGTASAQVTLNFDDITLENDSFINGSLGDTAFIYESASFPIFWDTTYKYWLGGWAASNRTDSSAEGTDGTYDARPAKAYSGSNFLVGQNSSEITFKSSGGFDYQPVSFQVALNAYAYNSLAKGDLFAKKFGGITGNDPDSLVLVSYVHFADQTKDSLSIVLADFRFADNSQDYILNDWMKVNLGTFSKKIDKISFSFQSSDVGQFGINTPTFFILDDLELSKSPNSVSSTSRIETKIFPNPSNGLFQLANYEGSWTIYNQQGQAILKGEGTSVDLRSFSNGIYFFSNNEGGFARIVKK